MIEDAKRYGSSVAMDPIVITVPHANCDTTGVDKVKWAHPCDSVAAPTAYYLAAHLRKRGKAPNVLIGNINRAHLDLNRPEAAHSAFHRTLESKLAPGCVYVDMHSFPGDDAYWGKVWGQNELVLCAYPGVNGKSSYDICSKLGRHGIRCKVELPEKLPLIKDYYLIQRFGPLARISLMIELNDTVKPQRRSYAMDVLGHYLCI